MSVVCSARGLPNCLENNNIFLYKKKSGSEEEEAKHKHKHTNDLTKTTDSGYYSQFCVRPANATQVSLKENVKKKERKRGGRAPGVVLQRHAIIPYSWSK